MKRSMILLAVLLVWTLAPTLLSRKELNAVNPVWNPLTPAETRIIVDKGTEAPFSGEYNNFDGQGVYLCRRCNAPLYRSTDKFHSGCGWPAFDDEIPGAVRRQTDADGRRTEILCAACGGHLGHVFAGEGLTEKNVRHCVNSLSLRFRSAAGDGDGVDPGRAILAGGCFWGVEYWLQQLPGVESVISGYTGGRTENPTYEEVCAHRTGHIEAVEVRYDPSVTDFAAVARRFFEIHDPTQRMRQGPDIGEQYQSAVFYLNEAQKQVCEELIGRLKARGYDVVTVLRPAERFWPAEDYHQDYYRRKGSLPYCHSPVDRFGE